MISRARMVDESECGHSVRCLVCVTVAAEV